MPTYYNGVRYSSAPAVEAFRVELAAALYTVPPRRGPIDEKVTPSGRRGSMVTSA
jgi:hypothetical protein